MISGMVISTIVTLVFTPVYYSVIDSFGNLFRRKKKKGPPPPDAPENEALPESSEEAEPAAT